LSATLAAWLVAALADAGRQKPATLVLGTDQERTLQSAGTAAAQQTAREFRPGDDPRDGVSNQSRRTKPAAGAGRWRHAE
jgi:hypothetical protein